MRPPHVLPPPDDLHAHAVHDEGRELPGGPDRNGGGPRGIGDVQEAAAVFGRAVEVAGGGEGPAEGGIVLGVRPAVVPDERLGAGERRRRGEQPPGGRLTPRTGRLGLFPG